MEINVISGALYTQGGKKIADVKDSSIMLVDEPYKQRTMEVAENIGKTHSITCQLDRALQKMHSILWNQHRICWQAEILSLRQMH
ncbi:hypothetical protein G4470_06395 [Blautia faecis]|uniref:hypothetical protein n=1 Tax=Blautia TaxID=572511 RepID=UPI00156E871F|nr:MULTISPECIES: hypothetical protein [Blautia]MCB5522647.1 hypothetical protein [Blautia schinkii]NSD60491.1 hypothetical protein [Blautia faecis]